MASRMMMNSRREGLQLACCALACPILALILTQSMRVWTSMRLRKLRGQCYVESYQEGLLQCVLVVSSKRFFEAIRKGLRDRVVPATIVMGGGHPQNILSSCGKRWQTQSKLIHKCIQKAGGRYNACLGTQLQSFRFDDGRVDLFNECARINRCAMADALGIPIFEYSARKMTSLFYAYGYLINMFVLPKWMAERVAFYLHELLFGCETRRITKIISSNQHKVCSEYAEAFGISETMGHLWAIVNGSSIPEASIICDIVADLANNVTEQDRVVEMLTQNRIEEFEQWIHEKCRTHVFFPHQTKSLVCDMVVDGVHLAAGQLVKVHLKWLNEIYPDMHTTGFGLRRCPGGRIGIHSVERCVAHIVRNYHVQAPPGLRFSAACRLQAACPYQEYSMGFKHIVAGYFHVRRRQDI